MVKCPRGTLAQIKANLAYTQKSPTLTESEVVTGGQGEYETVTEESEQELDSNLTEKRAPPTPRDELVTFFYSFFFDTLLKSWEGKPCLKEKLNTSKDSPPYEVEEYGESDFELVPCEDSSTSEYVKDIYQKRAVSLSKEKSSRSSKRKTETTETSEYLNEEDFQAFDSPKTFDPDLDAQFVMLNGVSYEGRVSRKQMEGKGIYYWEDGSSYKGDFEGGSVTGTGRLEFQDLGVYEGGVYKAFRHGEGLFCFPYSPVMYSGQWWLGKKHGHGLIVYNDPSTGLNFYSGQWQDGVKEGFGFRQYPSGSKYIGFWSNGKRHGSGVMLWNNKDIYRGQWKDGLMDGYGKYTWKSIINETLSYIAANTYRGFWSEGKKSGKGVFELKNGVQIETIWVDDIKEGPGRLICLNGVVITGDPLFQKNKPGLLGLQEDRTGLLLRDQLTHSKRRKEKIDMTHLVAYIMSLERAKAISIPLYAPVKTINLSFHTEKVYAKKAEEILRERRQFYLDFQLIRVNCEGDEEEKSCTYDNLTPEDLCTLSEIVVEEQKQLKNFIVFKSKVLRGFYKYYATLACDKKPPANCILLRLFLWQMLMDAQVPCSNLSLVDIDNLLAKEEYLLIENPHHPFARIQLWQFFHIFIILSWHLYGQYLFDSNGLVDNAKLLNFILSYKNSESKNVLKTSLKYFLDEVAQGMSFDGQHNKDGNYENKFEEKDMAPMEAMYEIYRQVGEPHSARDFVNVICHKKSCGNLPYIDRYFEKVPVYKKEGKNAMAIGGELCHITDPVPFNFPQILGLEEKSSEMDCKSDLGCLIDLKPKRVVQCLTQVCPGIVSEGLIVNMDYQLTFLEFYKAIVLCIRTALKLKIVREIRESTIEDKVREEPDDRPKDKEKTKETTKDSRKKSSEVSKKGKK